MIEVAAAFWIALTGATILFFDWIPTPLNRNILKSSIQERLPSSIIHTSVCAIFASLVALNYTYAHLASGIWFSIVFISAIFNWWIPYFFGIHKGEISPEQYKKEYSSNYTILPKIKDHPIVPDVQHSLIHLCVLLSMILSYVSFASYQ